MLVDDALITYACNKDEEDMLDIYEQTVEIKTKEKRGEE